MSRICKVQDCLRPFYAKELCSKHWKQLYRYGRLTPEREWKPSACTISNGICYIEIAPDKLALVDAEDADKVIGFNWHCIESKNNLYAIRNVSDGAKLMHRVILKTDSIIDHKNGNGLDNRKANLRQCTYAENAYNRRKRKGTTSIYKGVNYHKASRKWLAGIRFNHQHYYLGTYEDEYEAACVYNVAASLFFGEFASLNKL